MGRKLFQKFVAMITLLAITSSVAWATTPEVFLESMKDEAIVALHVQTGVDTQVSSATVVKADKQHQAIPEQPCNHGCHAASHLLGLLSHDDLASIVPTDFRIYPPGDISQVNSPSLKGLYRPPLNTPLI